MDSRAFSFLIVVALLGAILVARYRLHEVFLRKNKKTPNVLRDGIYLGARYGPCGYHHGLIGGRAERVTTVIQFQDQTPCSISGKFKIRCPPGTHIQIVEDDYGHRRVERIKD